MFIQSYLIYQRNIQYYLDLNDAQCPQSSIKINYFKLKMPENESNFLIALLLCLYFMSFVFEFNFILNGINI